MKEKHHKGAKPSKGNPAKHPKAGKGHVAKEGKYLDKTTAEWVEVLRSEDGLLRRLAVYALGEIGPAAKDALPALEEALRDRESYVRVWAAAALNKVEANHPEALKVIAECMHDELNFVRSLAAWHLGRNCANFAELENCLPELEQLLDDDDASVRTEAGIAFRKIEGKLGSPPELEVLAEEKSMERKEKMEKSEDRRQQST